MIMYNFKKKQLFTLHQGIYKIESGIIIKQKPFPNGAYSNIAVFLQGDIYNSIKDDYDYIRLYALNDCSIIRTNDINSSQLLKQYSDIEDLNYIQTYPLTMTKQKIYLFCEWAEKKGIMQYLTQEQIAGFCGVERPTVTRYLSLLRKMNLINYSNEIIK